MLAENLAEVFGRSSWNVSFHINMDASYMIGTDTFREGQVVFRPGPVYESAAHGASVSWMRSTWPETRLWLYSTLSWIFAG